MMAVVSMLLLGASGIDPKKMTEGEIEALLKPEQYIAVDTLGESHYLVKFMKGEKTIKELELKIGFKEYKSESLSVRIDHSAKIEGKIFDIRTVSYRKDSIYLNPTIHLSPDNTKIAISWENVIKRNNCEVEKIYELDSIMKTTNNRTGLRSVDKIEVYNEDGNKMYEVDGAEAGWDTYDLEVIERGLQGDIPEEIQYMDFKLYYSRKPYLEVEIIKDNGYLITASNSGEGFLKKGIGVITDKGDVVFKEDVRGMIRGSNLCEDDKNVYFAYVKEKAEIKRLEKKGKEIGRNEIGNGIEYGNFDVFKLGDRILLIGEKTENIWTGRETGKEIIYYDMNLKEKNRIQLYEEGMYGAKTYANEEKAIMVKTGEEGDEIIILDKEGIELRKKYENEKIEAVEGIDGQLFLRISEVNGNTRYENITE